MAQFAMDNRGGGQALPPYLQGRSPSPQGPYQTKPMITPKATVRPGEVRPQGGLMGKLFNRFRPQQTAPGGGPWGPGGPQPAVKPAAGKPAITPAMPSPQGAVQPFSPFKSMFDYGKGELEAARKSAMEDAQSDAAARGVFYGSPLTTSQGDIQTEYLKGLGKLTADISGMELDDKYRRSALAASMLAPHRQMPTGGIDPDIFGMLGQLFQGGSAAPKPEMPRLGPRPNMPVPKEQVKLRGVTPKPVS